MPEEVNAVEWMSGVLLGAVGLSEDQFEQKGTIVSPSGYDYQVFGTKDGASIIQTDIYRLYPVMLPTGQVGLMKIAVSAEANETLQYEVNVLRDLQEKAAEVDRITAERGRNPYNYGAFLPVVIETMVTDDNGRLIMFLGFDPSINNYRQFEPVSRVLDGKRVDLKTNVWILGKTLKVLDFAHRIVSVTNGYVDENNLLLETAQHGVLVFDWSNAVQSPNTADCLAEVADMAKVAWRMAGGTRESQPPFDREIMNEEQYQEYVNFLRKLFEGKSSALEAHDLLYEMANRIWPKEKKTDEFGTVTKRPFHLWKTYEKEE